MNPNQLSHPHSQSFSLPGRHPVLEQEGGAAVLVGLCPAGRSPGGCTGGFDGSATGEPLCKAMTVAHLFPSSSALFQTFLSFLELQASLLTLHSKIKHKHLCVVQGTF